MKNFLLIAPLMCLTSIMAQAFSSPQILCSENVVAKNGRPQEPEHIGTAGLDRGQYDRRRALGGLWNNKNQMYTLGFTLVTDNTVKVDVRIGDQIVNEGYIDLAGTARNKFLYTASSAEGPVTVQATCKY